MANIPEVMDWFMSDDTGISSKTIASFMLGGNARAFHWNSPPSDPSDLGRCLRLLEKFPEWKPRMREMAGINNEWARVIPHWEEVSSCMVDEVGVDWSKGLKAPKTYRLMKDKGF